MNVADSPVENQDIFHMIADIVARQRSALQAELPVSKAARIDRLTRAIDLVLDHRDDFIAAVNQDFGQRTAELTLFADILPSVQALKHARKNVGKWMRRDRRSPTFPLGLLGSRAWVECKPRGVVGIISPWNFPIGMVFSPLAGALAAGNRVIIKPSEHVPATSELTRKLIADYFSPEEITVFPGGVEVSETFTRQKLDHIFYTGSGRVGRMVMTAAAQNLVPVTLELGGKSPTVILPDCDIDRAARAIASAKMANAGQICVAPDYVFVPRGKMAALISALVTKAEEFYPEKAGATAYTALISQREKQRLQGYVADARARGATITTPPSYAGERDDNLMPFHVISKVTDDMTLMREEIFGPLLPVIPYDDIDEVIRYITDRDRPLVLYIMGRDRTGGKIRRQVIAGGVAYDEFLLHVGQEDLPFGGSGASGMGNYHGVAGFKCFSHEMSVFKRGPFDILGLLQARPPFGPRFRAYIRQELKK